MRACLRPRVEVGTQKEKGDGEKEKNKRATNEGSGVQREPAFQKINNLLYKRKKQKIKIDKFKITLPARFVCHTP